MSLFAGGKQKHISFRRELMLYMFITAGVLLIVLGIVLSAISRKTIEDNYRTSHESYMKLFNTAVNIRFEEIIDDARSLLDNDSYIEIMAEEGTDSHYFTYRSQNGLEKILNGIENGNKYIYGILAVNMDGKFLYISKSGTSIAINNFYREGSILSQPYIFEAGRAEGKEVIKGYNVLDDSDETMFSIVKQMNNPRTKKCMGYVIFTVSKNMIREVFGSNTNILADKRYFIVDSELPSDDSHYIIYSKNIDDDELDGIIAAYNSDENGRYLFSSYTSKNSNWDIVSVIRRQDLKNNSAYIGWVTLAGIMILIIICFILSAVITGRINRPLEDLEKAISEVGNGNYRPDIAFDESEIGKVGQYLLNISENNLELRDKLLHSELNEREAQLLLLQSQINPHFLYNTLDALYFMAVIDGTDDIAEMVKSLSDYFRLSLNKGDRFITLRDAVSKIQAYLQIENMRYQNRFDLNVDIDDAMMDEKIMSFVLQPIVENAVIHGLEGKTGHGQVDIIGYIEDSLLHITVHDNGVGIADISQVDKGYGIRNVRERIHLFYGEEYDVVFESQAGVGTTVFITLPSISGKENDTEVEL